jgi:toxin ParE1/3/4
VGRTIIWSPSAKADLKSIVSYVAEYNREAALRLGIKIIDASKQIEKFEKSARVVPEFCNPEVRELITGSYRVIFRVKGERIEIIRVWHAARGQPEI